MKFRRNNFYRSVPFLCLLAGSMILIAGPHVKAEILVEAEDLPRVMVVTVEGEIKAGTVQFVKRALGKAERDGADLFVMQLNTPGGLLRATEEITRLLLDSEMSTAVFVQKSGGWAFSAGTFILLSAEIAASHPTASIGAAQPRILGVGGAAEPDDKIIESSSRWMKSLAEARGRNIEVAEQFVRENLTLSGEEAYELNIIDFTAVSLGDLIDQIGLQNAVVQEVHPNLIEQILSFLSVSYLVPLLLGIGTLGLFFVFRTGEVEVGVLAAIALLLGLWGIGAINLSVMGVALLVLGIALIAFEIFATPGFGIFGLVGTAAFLFGIFTFAQEPFLPTVLTEPGFWLAIGMGLGAALFFIIFSRLALKALKSKAKFGPEALVGEIAFVTESLSPHGMVKLNREAWSAKNINEDMVIEAETEVEVVKVEGNVLVVKNRAVAGN